MGHFVEISVVLPPVIAIIFVLWKKEVILALFMAIWTAEILLNGKDGIFGSLFPGLISSFERLIAVFQNADNSRVLVFSLVIGALLAFIRSSGGVSAVVEMLIRRGVAGTRRKAAMLPFVTGLILFIETNVSILTAGIISQGLFDKFDMSRARLAFIIDSTSAPVCILILFNAWGAFVLALLSGYDLDQPVSILAGSVPLNFYALITLGLVLYTILSDRVYGPMKTADCAPKGAKAVRDISPGRSRYMILPLTVMVGGILGFMVWTGNGHIAEGDGAKSVMYATFCAVLTAYIMLVREKVFTHHRLVEIGFTGMGELLPLVTVVLLAMALGGSLKDLGTGIFIANLMGEHIPIFLVVPVLFLTGAMMSFTTGSSWGTFAILIPIGVPLIQTLGLPPSLVLSAILGGGIFGDHCSPISDTTLVSSIAAGCELIEHVKTQLPYALTAGGAAFILYIVASVIMIS